MSAASSKLSRKIETDQLLEHAAAFLFAVTAFVFAYLFFEVVILIFSAILTALLLSLVANPLEEHLKIQRWASVTAAAIVVIGVAGGAGYLFGTRLVTDIQDVLARMSAAQNSIRASLEGSDFGKMLLSQLGPSSISVTQLASSIFSISANLIAGLVVAIISGAYLAAQPSLYLDGFLTLFPRTKRAYAEETVAAVGNGLFRWLEGQFISMALVGILSALATWLIGLPSPFALGLIAGITEFIPYVGPIIAAIPALLVAATNGWSFVLWTAVAYIGIHLIEGNFVAPLIQRQLVYVPPAIMLLGIASIGTIFGAGAVLFAAPIVVVVFVLIKKLYVRDSLGEQTPLPGEETVIKEGSGSSKTT